MRSYSLPAIITGLLISNVAASAQTFTAKVVGVHDGDTISVYDGREQTRIRVEGIDCPETGANFSTRAKQLTSDLVFGIEGFLDEAQTTDAIDDAVCRLHTVVVFQNSDGRRKPSLLETCSA